MTKITCLSSDRRLLACVRETLAAYADKRAEIGLPYKHLEEKAAVFAEALDEFEATEFPAVHCAPGFLLLARRESLRRAADDFDSAI